MSNSKKLPIVFGTLSIGLFLILSVGIGIFITNSNRDQAILATHEAEKNQAATEVALIVKATMEAPTATPTVTLKPTRTPRPTSTPKPTKDPIQITYVQNIWAMLRKCQAGGELFATQMRLANSTGNAALVITLPQWQIDTEKALSSVEATCAQWKNVGPVPPMFQELHSYIVLFSDEMQMAVDAYRIGFANLDADAITSGNDHIGTADTHLEKIKDYMIRIPEH